MATRRKDGRWVVRKRTAEGRICGYGSTQEEAEADLLHKLTLLNESPVTLEVRTLHEVAIVIWYPHVQTLAPLTRKRYESVYLNYIRRQLGHLALDEVTPLAVRSWFNRLDASQDSKRYALNVLKSILSHAEKLDLIRKNPCSAVQAPRTYQKRHRILELDAAAELLEGSRDTVLSLPVFLGAVLALRRGEIAGLKWADLDRVKGELRIVRQRQAVRPNGVIERELKTEGSRRTLYLPQSIIEEIDKRGDLDSEYMATYKGKPWVPDTITEKWSELRDGFGLPDWHFHDLRHQAAGMLAAAGCDLLVIAAVLGHSKPDMALLYTSVADSRRREGADLLAKLIGPQAST